MPPGPRTRLFFLAATTLAAAAHAACGDVVDLPVRAGVTLRYALSTPAAGEAAATLVLLAGGDGRLALDGGGCPNTLTGNSLVRSKALFLQHGLATAYVDAPSDHTGTDGLAAFRSDPEHAADLGQVIADLRRRSGRAVWVVGTSRGAISAANAAARLQGPAAPDGVVLTSPVMVGTPQGRKAWTAQSVFDLPLEAIRMPLLLVGHTEDTCLRSPAAELPAVAARSPSVRQQTVMVNGGPGARIAPGLAACEGRSPHGFIEQEEEVAAGIARFVRGGRY